MKENKTKSKMLGICTLVMLVIFMLPSTLAMGQLSGAINKDVPIGETTIVNMQVYATQMEEKEANIEITGDFLKYVDYRTEPKNNLPIYVTENSPIDLPYQKVINASVYVKIPNNASLIGQKINGMIAVVPISSSGGLASGANVQGGVAKEVTLTIVKSEAPVKLDIPIPVIIGTVAIIGIGGYLAFSMRSNKLK